MASNKLNVTNKLITLEDHGRTYPSAYREGLMQAGMSFVCKAANFVDKLYFRLIQVFLCWLKTL